VGGGGGGGGWCGGFSPGGGTMRLVVLLEGESGGLYFKVHISSDTLRALLIAFIRGEKKGEWD